MLVRAYMGHVGLVADTHHSKSHTLSMMSPATPSATTQPNHAVHTSTNVCCNKIAEAEAVVSVNEKKWLVMHVHV